MKDLMKTNCFDASDVMVIMGSCLPCMQPKAFEELLKISPNIYEVCLERDHVNMAITKLAGMLCRVKVKKLIFATIDKSLHCIQVHYMFHELKKIMDLKDIEVVHYVAVNNTLVEVSDEKVKKSRCLSEL